MPVSSALHVLFCFRLPKFLAESTRTPTVPELAVQGKQNSSPAPLSKSLVERLISETKTTSNSQTMYESRAEAGPTPPHKQRHEQKVDKVDRSSIRQVTSSSIALLSDGNQPPSSTSRNGPIVTQSRATSAGSALQISITSPTAMCLGRKFVRRRTWRFQPDCDTPPSAATFTRPAGIATIVRIQPSFGASPAVRRQYDEQWTAR